MELKEGMYVRIKDKNNNQFIRKIIKLPEDTRYGSIVVDKDIHYARWVSKKKVIKASSNIIGLIQVGDYVNGNKVIRIETSSYPEDKNVKIIVCCGDDDYYSYYNKDIKTILTKEQYENNCYKLEE